MFIAILTLLSALSISGVAIFYSVIGLATIFPGAFWPVVIMGSVLEVGKLITASWLYRQWKFTPFLLKTYLTIAVVLLSIITSMGIFGFLSKAHLEQNLASDTLVQRVDIINDKIESQTVYIERQKAVILRSEKAIDRAGKDFTQDIAVQENIINSAYARLQVLDADVKAYTDQGKGFFKGDNIKRGVELRTQQKPERDKLNAEIEEAKALIQKYRDQSRQGGDSNNVTIEQAETNIITAQNKIDDLIIDRQPLEKKLINLEAEVGPVKYIAALAVDWGMTEEVNLSKAVRWVILLIIVEFDPLAVLLLIAANQSFARRFPPTPPKPQVIVDLEKPDEEGIVLKWNAIQEKHRAQQKDKIENQIQDWQDKLQKFNEKVPKPSEKPVEIIQEDNTVPHVELKSSAKEEKIKAFEERMKAEEAELERVARETREDLERLEKNSQSEELVDFDGVKTQGFEPKETVDFDGVKTQGFDENEHKYDMDPVTEDPEEHMKAFVGEPEEFDEERMDIVAQNGNDGLHYDKIEEKDSSIAEQIEEAMEDVKGRVKPDFTEVLEPEVAVVQKHPTKGMLGTVFVEKGKVIKQVPATPYKQNEEQKESDKWSQIKYHKRTLNEEQYHEKIERKLTALVEKIEKGELKLSDLAKADQVAVSSIMKEQRK